MNRPARIAEIRQTLAAGGATIGSWIQIPHPSIAEIMAQAGYDWIAVDLEHGTIGVEQLPDLFRALELGDTLPLARVAEATAQNCRQALDAGAGGVILPMIEDAGQLAAVIGHCCWPPAGVRGVGFSRANMFGRRFADYAAEARAPLVVAMIEHRRAIEHLEQIVAVDGLDAILIGPYDLSASLGITGQFDTPAFVATLDRIRAVCDGVRMPCGVHVVEPSVAALQRHLDSGYRFLPFSIDAVFLTSAGARPVLDLPRAGWAESSDGVA